VCKILSPTHSQAVPLSSLFPPGETRGVMGVEDDDKAFLVELQKLAEQTQELAST
jgi:hypothetical protein